MLELMIKGASFGLNAGISPGPLQAYLLSSTLTLGWRRAMPIIFAPLITDAPIIFVCAFLLDQLPNEFLLALRVVGGLFVLWLAWLTFKSARQYVPPSADVELPAGSPLPRALMMNYLSPGPYIFWTSVTGPLLSDAFNVSPLNAGLFLLSFYVPFLGTLALLIVVFARMGQLNPNVTRGLLMLSAVIMALLGALLLYEALGGPLI
jgi:threonine/homoserine/homoserine lactone efflux protein